MKKMRALALILTLACALSLTGCASAQQKKQTAIGFYLDTVITLTAYVDDQAVLEDALKECGRYERLLSRTIEGSDVWNINHANGQPVEVSDDTLAILDVARQVSERSGGAFDVTIAPVSTLWDFTSGAAQPGRVESSISSAASIAGMRVFFINISLYNGCLPPHATEERAAKCRPYEGSSGFGGFVPVGSFSALNTRWATKPVRQPTAAPMPISTGR